MAIESGVTSATEVEQDYEKHIHDPKAHRTMVLNMGPQHPSTHGVLRLLLELDGETILKAAPDIGYLHTGIEKEFEAKTYQQGVTLTDRIDYLAPLSNNLVYCLAAEQLLGLEIPPLAQFTRHGAEHARAYRLVRIVNHHRRVFVEANVGSVTATMFFAGADNDRLHHFALLHRAFGRGFFHRRSHNVAEAGLLAQSASQRQNHLQLACTGVVGNREHSSHLHSHGFFSLLARVSWQP